MSNINNPQEIPAVVADQARANEDDVIASSTFTSISANPPQSQYSSSRPFDMDPTSDLSSITPNSDVSTNSPNTSAATSTMLVRRVRTTGVSPAARLNAATATLNTQAASASTVTSPVDPQDNDSRASRVTPPPVPRGPPPTRIWMEDDPDAVIPTMDSRPMAQKTDEIELGITPRPLERSTSSESMSDSDTSGQSATPLVISNYQEIRRAPIIPLSVPCRRAVDKNVLPLLTPGTRFTGTQEAERQRYEVQVDIHSVDLSESYLSGYLRISGLTDRHRFLTTFFEGEIVGSKYSFFTNHPEWGANRAIDLSHWARFQPFRKFVKPMRQGAMPERDQLPDDCVFMRWKECFLVPDHKVTSIEGASFEGFYYVCLNTTKGEISGIYFHGRSEKFQQLKLVHEPQRTRYRHVELR